MKNGFKFHVLYYIVAFICFLTGYFKDFIWISILIIIHELGHVTGAILCRFQIDRVVILPFGGMTILNDRVNRPISQELLILVLGPIYQQLFFLILCKLHLMHATFSLYHYVLLFFNLLPIVPLDGSKLIELLLERFFPYKKAKYICFFFSIFTFFFYLFYTVRIKNLFLGLISLFLIQQQIRYWNQIPYVFSKFIYERYLYTWNFKRHHKIKGERLAQMKRDCIHIFEHNGWHTEKEIINKQFSKLIK